MEGTQRLVTRDTTRHDDLRHDAGIGRRPCETREGRRATEEVNQMADKKISPKAPEGARNAEEPAARVTKKQTMKKVSHKKISRKKLSR